MTHKEFGILEERPMIGIGVENELGIRKVLDKVAPAQSEALAKWGAPQKSFDYLKSIKQPTLVVNGSNGRDGLHGKFLYPATANLGIAILAPKPKALQKLSASCLTGLRP
jgi:hypothetical protein